MRQTPSPSSPKEREPMVRTDVRRVIRPLLPRQIALLAGAILAALLALTIRSGEARAVVPGNNGKIAFTTNRDGDNEIFGMNADGTAQTRLTNNTADDTRPAWSPNGQKIAFTTHRDGNNEVYV